jgi:hypothetical protein
MTKFSGGENPEGVIGDVAAHSAPPYDATSQIQKFWFSVVVQLFAGPHGRLLRAATNAAASGP